MADTIWGARMPDGSACTKIPYKGYVISIAMDDSCGAFPDYRRSSLSVFHNGAIVTDLFGTGKYASLPADAETLKAIFYKIDALTKESSNG